MRDHFDHEIRTLEPDELITEPGFYNIPMERHHNQPCDGYSVTSSVLRTVELNSPADLWLRHPDNPDREVEDDKTAFRLGRVMAAYIERGPEGMEEFVRILPSAPASMSVPEMMKLAKSGSVRPKAPPQRPTFDQIVRYVEGNPTPAGARAVEYWYDIDRDPREKVSEKEWEMIAGMGRALAADPAACAALGGIPEITMAWQDDRTGIWCLARPDQISFSGMISDYKKVNTQGRPFNGWLVDGRITQHGYDMQMAFAAMGFEILTRNKPDQVGLVFQCDAKPHHVILREIEEEDLRIGEFRNNRALQTISNCIASGDWPGPGEHVEAYRRNKAQRERLLEEMNFAGVAP
ncbi:hypothetical protein A8B82_15080 [Sulfitobacter sp. EhC04]|uniref:PD-(D/E)XK nuclease-like domain-containing protein n=1 Tax=Sulfitobacter sp. EhC04 TaxID=1849168 RepID=UPI0007F463AA|nr:PD-(D/E)XK nuclease-like domain-containing protein [Sulfitobacter sp. EhC04]OAN76716.1 hypothetical protein A8B82_15080 [Sulfitobacter sp. EhC04]